MNKRMIQELRAMAQQEARRQHNRTLEKQISHYMAATLQPHIDPRTNEVDATNLAVDAAVGLGHPEWLDDEQNVVWDLAVDMAEKYKQRQPEPEGFDQVGGDIAEQAANSGSRDADVRSRMEQDPITGHHPDCECFRCHFGDDLSVWVFNGRDY